MADLLDFERLERIAAERHEEFASARPFPHVVIDDFLPVEVAERLLEDFDRTTEGWNHYHHYNEKKLAVTDSSRMQPFTRELFAALQSPRFVGFVEKLSGIEGLLSDPDLDGAGLHCIRPGGYLNVHTDFLAHNKRRSWSRQINLLIYLNKDWRKEWRGDLELWDKAMQRCTSSVSPDFNRCVVFHTCPGSYHGHPHPLACPEGNARKSIALYYFRDEGRPCELTPTDYRALPDASWRDRWLVAADRQLVRAYSFLKRYAGLSDRLISRLLRRL